MQCIALAWDRIYNHLRRVSVCVSLCVCVVCVCVCVSLSVIVNRGLRVDFSPSKRGLPARIRGQFYVLV